MADPLELLRSNFSSESEFIRAIDSGRKSAECLASKHQLALGDYLPGASTSLVISAGENHVIKVVLLGEEADSGTRFLSLAQGHGVIAIEDQQDGAMLMPRIRPGTDISSLPTEEAITVFCTHANRFREIGNFDGLAEAYSFISDEELRNPFLTKMLDTTKEVCAVHGDLHHYNILFDGRDTVVIDPKGLVADPCMEAAAILRNPIPQPSDIDLGQAIEQIAIQCELDPNRVWGWARAITELCAVGSGPLVSDFALACYRISSLSNRFWI